MKDFDKDDKNQIKDKTITIPSIEKEVSLMLCVLAATFCLRRVSFLRQGFIFWYCSVILCVCVCAEVEQQQHKATRKVSTRGHVLFTGVLCVACLLCVRFFLLFFPRSACVCVAPLHLQVHQPEMRDANE